MGKSARSSRIKTNRSKLKKTVHDPVLDARMQRLSDKLLEIAQSNKTEKKDDEAMEVEKPAEATETATEETSAPSTGGVHAKRLSKGKIARKTKSRNTMVFKSMRKGARVSTKKSRK